ncbi:hypothetical protein NPIL_57181 [Nephila pilipes]|uniref:Uncharacterized protein n=1 Tax=Nephila pilipes TaxID=299642 RepID=A0A8X6U0R7_NEPPI|nr:hypothetical protein NPIL_57181 [Nephila pilipes]
MSREDRIRPEEVNYSVCRNILNKMSLHHRNADAPYLKVPLVLIHVHKLLKDNSWNVVYMSITSQENAVVYRKHEEEAT